MQFSKPLKNIWYITVFFGEELWYGKHKGLDLRVKDKHFPSGLGMPLYAPADGKVTLHKWDERAGNMLFMDHGDGWTTRYYHLTDYVGSQGRDVKEGDLIGHCGGTGIWSTGPHLHWEVRKNNIPVDPLKYLKDDASNNDIFNGMFKNEQELKDWLKKEGYVKKDPDLFQDKDGSLWRCKNNMRYKLGTASDDFTIIDARFVQGWLNDDHKSWPVTTNRKDVY